MGELKSSSQVSSSPNLEATMSTQVCSIIVTTNKQVCSPTQSLCSLGGCVRLNMSCLIVCERSIGFKLHNTFSTSEQTRSSLIILLVFLPDTAQCSSAIRHSLRWVLAVLSGLSNCVVLCTYVLFTKVFNIVIGLRGWLLATNPSTGLMPTPSNV